MSYQWGAEAVLGKGILIRQFVCDLFVVYIYIYVLYMIDKYIYIHIFTYIYIYHIRIYNIYNIINITLIYVNMYT